MFLQKVRDSMNCTLLHCQMPVCRREDEGSRNIGKQSIGAALVALCESLQISCPFNMPRSCSQLFALAMRKEKKILRLLASIE